MTSMMDRFPVDPAESLSVELEDRRGKPAKDLVETPRRETAGTLLIANCPPQAFAP
jgi:hypothetical protein